MKQILLVAVSAALLSACAASGPPTAWGKAGVSKVDYGTDVGMCTGYAALQQSTNGANTAGGINGQNGSAPATSGGDAAKGGGGPGGGSNSSPSTAATPTGGGGIYRDSMPQDMVQRAATQQRSQEMEAQRRRAETLKSCLYERGYQEFALTPEQRAHIATLKIGSNEYHSYLYSLGADPVVLSKQGLAKK